MLIWAINFKKLKLTIDNRIIMWYNKRKLKQNKGLEEINMFDFENEIYSIKD